MELMIASHAFSEHPTTQIFENDVISNQIEKSSFFKHALEDDLQLGDLHRRLIVAGDCAPGLEPFATLTQGAYTRLHAVRYDKCYVCCKQNGNLSLVCLH